MGFWKHSSPKTKPLELLRAFSQGLSAIAQIKDLLKQLLESLVEIAQVQGGSIWLMEEASKGMALREASGGEPLVLEFKRGDPFINYLGQIRKVLSKTDLFKDRQYIDIREAGVKFFTSVHGAWVYPLFVQPHFLGVIVLGPRRDGRPYPQELRELLEILVPIAAIALENALRLDAMGKQNLKLSEIAKLKTEFVSTISHELSTPLNGILGLTEILLDPAAGGNLNDDQQRYLQMIQSAAEELAETVGQVLNLTRFQSQQGALEVRRVDLSRVIDDILKDFEGVLSEKGMGLKVDLPLRSAVYGDEGQIRQLLQNLLENAVKFSESSQGGDIRLQGKRLGEMLQVCVSDPGIGIAEADQELIFEEFRQADGGVERAYGGTGLGLAVAKKIVELHGGRIWVESKKGEGSQFYFTLPLKPGLVQAREIEAPQPAAS